MRKNVKKILCISALVGLMLCSFGGFACIQTAKANTPETTATETSEEQTDILTMDGAFIRFKEQADGSVDKSGIRFSGYVKESYLTENLNAKVGMLIIPATEMAEGEELTESVKSVGISEAKVFITGEDRYAKEGYKRFTTVLYGIPETAYATQIVARAYIFNNDTYTLADHTETRSIAQVASIGLAQGGGANAEEYSAYVNATNPEITVETTANIVVGETKTLGATITPAGLMAVYASNDTDVVTVDASGNVKGISEGNATITITIGSTTKEVAVKVSNNECQVTFKDSYERTMTVEYGTKFSEITSRSVSELYWDENYSEQVTESDAILGDATIYIKEEDKNTTEILSFDYACDVDSSAVRFASAIENNPDSSATWVSEFEGETGVMKVDCASWGTWVPQFFIKKSIAADSEIYDTYDYLVVKIYVVNDETYTGNWDYVSVEQTSGSTDYAITTNSWNTVKIDLSELQTLNDDEEIKIFGKDGDTDAALKKGLWYIADVSLEAISNTLTFTSDNYDTYLSAKGTGTFAWSESANAMQLSYTEGTYCGVTFSKLPWTYDWATSRGYGYIAVDLYIVGDTTDIYDSTLTSTISLAHLRTNLGEKMILCEEGGKKTDGNSDNQWITVALPLECLDQSSFQIYDQQGKTLARMYIRSMQLKKAELTVNVESSVESGAFVYGQNFTVSAITSGGVAVDMTSTENFTYVLSTTGYSTGNIAGKSAGTTSIASSRGATQYVWVTDTATGEIGYAIITLSAATA